MPVIDPAQIISEKQSLDNLSLWKIGYNVLITCLAIHIIREKIIFKYYFRQAGDYGKGFQQ